MKINKVIFKGLVFISTISVVLTGCGGGSSSSSAELSFPETSVQAEPTLENGKKVESATATNQIGGVPGLNSVENQAQINAALLGAKLSKKFKKLVDEKEINAYSLNVVFDETEKCVNGGTLRIYGSGSEDAGINATFVANNCNDSYDIVNGSMTMILSDYDNSIDEFKFLSIRYNSEFTVKSLYYNTSATVLANSLMNIWTTKFSQSGDLEDFRLTISVQATDGSDTYGLKNCEFYFLTKGDELHTYQTKGKIYIDSLASFVDYDTSYDMSKTPFVFSGYNEVLISGEARYLMSGNGKVKIKVESNDAKTYVDADGDGTYELSE